MQAVAVAHARPAVSARSAQPEAYKCSEVVLLEEIMRKAIRARVIEIGVTKAHSIVRRRKPNMAGRRLSSIYSKNDAGPAVSLKELIATLAVLGEDPLDELFEHLQRRRGQRQTAAVRNYRKSLERMREEIESKRQRRRKSPANDHPTLFDMERA